MISARVGLRDFVLLPLPPVPAKKKHGAPLIYPDYHDMPALSFAVKRYAMLVGTESDAKLPSPVWKGVENHATSSQEDQL